MAFQNYPELPRNYAEKVDRIPELRILYTMLEGREKPVDLYRSVCGMLQNGYVVDFNTSVENLNYCHYKWLMAKRDGKVYTFPKPVERSEFVPAM